MGNGMKTTLSLEFENDELSALRRTVNTDAAFGILHDFAQELRKRLKYEELGEEGAKALQWCSDTFWGLCAAERIDPIGD
jgi:hypothetical protein